MATKTEFRKIRADTNRLLERPAGVDAEDIVAFANASGGTILVGVKEVEADGGLQRGQVVGCQVGDQIKVGFLNRASSCRPARAVAGLLLMSRSL